MNAALGGVSAGGPGTPLFDVTQSGGGPSAFVASHPAGNAGGVRLSKFSRKLAGTQQKPGHDAVAVGVAPTVENTSFRRKRSSSVERDPY
jgi:hypothetical protein